MKNVLLIITIGLIFIRRSRRKERFVILNFAEMLTIDRFDKQRVFIESIHRVVYFITVKYRFPNLI